MEDQIEIRPVRDKEDVISVISLTSNCFPEEVRATGIPVSKWRDLKTDQLIRNPTLMEQCGIAIANGEIIGAIILSLDNEQPNQSLVSYWEVTRKAGCLPTLLTMCYDRVLDESLKEHECLIDFLAVSPKARGKGVGAMLLRWAQSTAVDILARRSPEIIAQNGGLISLWVAANNTRAIKLYRKQGFAVIHKTDQAACSCLSSLVFRCFLGAPVWLKMQRSLHVPDDISIRVQRKSEMENPKLQRIDLVAESNTASRRSTTHTTAGVVVVAPPCEDGTGN